MILYLTTGEEVLIDDADFPLVSQFKWYRHVGRTTLYASVCVRRKGGRFRALMHRLIMSAGPGQCVDHIDHNGLNNKRSNLRIASQAENARNMNKRPGAFSSKFKGVAWNGPTNKWRAQITKDRKLIYLGCYEKEIDAAAAYDAAARRLFGAFALTNGADLA